MTYILTRSEKGSPLSHEEMDNNWLSLNDKKAEISSVNTHGAYLYLDTPTLSVCPLETWIKLSGSCSVGEQNGNILSTNNRIKYTGQYTKSFIIDVNISISSAGANDIFYVGIAKNGVVQETKKSALYTRVGAIANASIHVWTTLAMDDYIEVFLKNLTSGENASVEEFQFRAFSVFTTGDLNTENLINNDDVGQAGGVAPLDEVAKLPSSFIKEHVVEVSNITEFTHVHNFGRHVSIIPVDLNNEQVQIKISRNDANSFTIFAEKKFSGKIYFS